MLRNGSYPYYLKKRIVSDVGHLSNKQAFELLHEHADQGLSAVFLSHLSAENNKPEIAFNEFELLKQRIAIYLTSREEAGIVARINKQ